MGPALVRLMEQFFFPNVKRAVRDFPPHDGLRQFMTSWKLTETGLNEKGGYEISFQAIAGKAQPADAHDLSKGGDVNG